MSESYIYLVSHSAFAIAVVSIAAIAGLLIYAWSIRGAVARREMLVMFFLRLIVVLGVITAFFEVAIRREQVIKKETNVLVLIDTSLSMEVMGAKGVTRAEQVVQFFENNENWFEKLEREHVVRYFVFDSTATEVKREDLGAAVVPKGGATDILKAIDIAMRNLTPDEIGGVLLFTDGNDNGSLSEAIASGSFPITPLPGPIYSFLPVPPEDVRDIALTRVSGLDYVLVRELTEVRCEVKSIGYETGELTVTLSSGGEILAQERIDLAEASMGTEVVLKFLPREPGPAVFDVSVSQLPGEVTWSDNAKRMVVNVLRDRTRALHVAGHPSWDVRFLREYLRNRPDFEVVSFHMLRSAEKYESKPDEETTLIPFPAEEIFINRIEGFDIVILQDYELTDYDGDRYAQSLVRYVKDGGAVMIIGGSYCLGGRGPWPNRLDPILPVSAPKSYGHGMAEGRFEVELTNEGKGHPALAGINIAGAPPMYAINLVGPVKPSAIALLQAYGEGLIQPVPFAVVSEIGRGRVVLLLTDTIWRWSFDPSYHSLYKGLLDGLVGYATKDPNFAPLQLIVLKPFVVVGDEQEVLVRNKGVEDVTLKLQREVSPGHFEDIQAALHASGDSNTVRFRVEGPGSWRVIATGKVAEATVESQGVFASGPSSDEIKKALSSSPIPAMLATKTGGRVYTLDNVDLSTVTITPETEVKLGGYSDEPIWNHPVVLIFMLIALGVEWFIERKIGYT